MPTAHPVFTPSEQNKIFCVSEVRAEFAKLAKAEMSLPEKLYASTLGYVSVLGMHTNFLIDAHKPAMRRRLLDANMDFTTGLWFADGAEAYISEETWAIVSAYEGKFSLNKEFSRRMWALEERAVASCKDYRGLRELAAACQERFLP